VKLSRNTGILTYPIRLVGYFSIILIVYFVRQPQKEIADLMVWLCLLFLCIYPHLAFSNFLVKPKPETEFNSLLIDMLVIGVVSNLVYLDPAIFIPLLVANSTANYALKGPRFMVKGVFAFALGLMISFIFLGFEFKTADNRYLLIPTLLYLFLTTHHIAYVSYTRSKYLMSANNKMDSFINFDALTKMPNRHYFDDKLENEWHRSFRQQQVLSVLSLDIDYFKTYLDLYGLAHTDDCLKQVAQAIAAKVTRSADIVARIEEGKFSIILPYTDQDGAFVVAQKVLESIQNLKIKHEGSFIETIVTVSIGTASIIPVKSFTALGLVLAADQALKLAKDDDGNCIRVKTIITHHNEVEQRAEVA